MTNELKDITMRVRQPTWKRLNDLKDGHTTFDQILNRLMDIYDATGKAK